AGGPPASPAAPGLLPGRRDAARPLGHRRTHLRGAARAPRGHRDGPRRRPCLRAAAAPMDREPILDARDVAYRYPGAVRDALAGVSLALRAGAFHAVLGPNGSGKTTLVRVALGLLSPRAGTAAILGRAARSEEHTSELQSRFDLVCRLL